MAHADPDASDAALNALVVSAQGGDAAALDELLARIRPLVTRRCARILPYVADAEEAAQDALLAISTKLGSFAGTGSFLGWVNVVAANCARMTYRSLVRRAEIDHAVLPEGADPRTTSVIAGTRLDVLDAVEELERLHPHLVQPFLLRELGGLSYAEIATATDVPMGTVKARIHHARRFLRERLAAPDLPIPPGR